MARKKRKVVRKKDKLARTIKNEIIGIVIMGLACLGFVILFSENSSPVAVYLVRFFRLLAGDGSPGIFIMLGVLSINFMAKNKKSFRTRMIGFFILWLSFQGFIHLGFAGDLDSAGLVDFGKAGKGGGLIGAGLSVSLYSVFDKTGSYVVLTIFTVIGSMLAFNRSLVETIVDFTCLCRQAAGAVKTQISDFFKVLESQGQEKAIKKKEKQRIKEEEARAKKEAAFIDKDYDVETIDSPLEDSFLQTEAIEFGQNLDFSQEYNNEQRETAIEKEEPKQSFATPKTNETEITKAYSLPPLQLLRKPMKKGGQKANKNLVDSVRLLEETLASFGVKVKVTRVIQGPTITRFEVQPAPGVKVSKITSLADDIALNLASSDVRMEAPIPGKSAVGIEVPNREVSLVHLREVLESKEFQNSKSKLSVALGKDIAGMPVICDLTKMPHLLIAGATGSGKSVCINTAIASIVYKAKPEEVKLLLIDPKMVELTIYNGIPHLIAPVVTEPKKAASALKWIVTEMETRYELFAALGVRDIVRYNFIVRDKKDESQKQLPYIVVIIDELADLMMISPVDVEEAICRLAQMARAAGIHLIVATQRPSVDVITGLIKANIPSRIAFAVSSQTDSRTILDTGGAEKLLGSGDMLYNPIGFSKPLRVQGCFLGDKEIRNIVNYLVKQAKPEYHEIPEVPLQSSTDSEPEDELFYKAANVFFENNTASVSLLQRKLRIGYARAARLMDIMEDKGIVGQYEGSKPRELLISKGQFEQLYGKLDNS
ncbi:MAG: DNA translocase FtsK [Desulfitobacteriia bacterium]